jgi:integrase
MREVLRRRYAARGNSRYVFPGWIDRATAKDEDAPRDSTRAIRRAMARIGVNKPDKVARYGRRDVRSLRDTFATKLRKKGMSLDRLQMLLGHASPQMTQKYADVGVTDISNEAVAILDAMA